MKSIVAPLAIALLLVTLAPAGHAADEKTIGQRVDDAAITAAVKAKLVADRPGNLATIDVDTSGGVVRLHGTVPTARVKAEAERLARHTKGVRDVANEIKVEARGASAGSQNAIRPR